MKNKLHMNLLVRLGMCLNSPRYNKWLFRHRASHIVLCDRNDTIIPYVSVIRLPLYKYIQQKIHNTYCVMLDTDITSKLVETNGSTMFLVVPSNNSHNIICNDNVKYLSNVNMVYDYVDRPIYLLSNERELYTQTINQVSTVLYAKLNESNKPTVGQTYPVNYLLDSELATVSKTHRISHSNETHVNVVEYHLNFTNLTPKQNDLHTLFFNGIIN